MSNQFILLDQTLLQKAFPLPPLGGSRDPRTWVSIDNATRRRYYQADITGNRGMALLPGDIFQHDYDGLRYLFVILLFLSDSSICYYYYHDSSFIQF